MMYGLYEKMEEYVPVLFFLLIFTLMVVQVFTRYLIHFSMAWNIELCRYSFVWLTFLGAPLVRRNDAHIKLDTLFHYINSRMPPGMQKALWVFKQVLSVAFLVYLIYFGFILASRSYRFPSQAMQLPQFYLYISVTLGGCGYLFRELQYSFRHYREHFSRK
jgi:TRAP-type C4-dicarboxylate transport system permease small subunit